MAAIILSPIGSGEASGLEAVNLTILVRDTDWVGSFNTIEVWRSRGTSGGPFEPLTAPTWLPAQLPESGGAQSVLSGPSVDLAGKSLRLYVDKTQAVPILFTGGGLLTFADAASQINLQSLGLLVAYVDSANRLVVKTQDLGVAATLEVEASDAASLLALPLQAPDNYTFGKDAHIQLTPGLTSYTFTDPFGSKSYFYRMRFRDSLTGSNSEFSLPFSPNLAQGIAASSLVQGYLYLAKLDGKPLAGREVALRSEFTGNSVDGYLLAGCDLAQKTNDAGYVSFLLVRGQEYHLSIAGMNLVKTVITPTNPDITSFSLIDPTHAPENDYFRVRVPEIPMLERRSL